MWPETYDWVNFRRVAVEFLPWGIGWYGQQLPDDEIKRHPSLQGETEYQDCAALMADQGKWDDEVQFSLTRTLQIYCFSGAAHI